MNQSPGCGDHWLMFLSPGVSNVLYTEDIYQTQLLLEEHHKQTDNMLDFNF